MIDRHSGGGPRMPGDSGWHSRARIKGERPRLWDTVFVVHTRYPARITILWPPKCPDERSPHLPLRQRGLRTQSFGHGLYPYFRSAALSRQQRITGDASFGWQACPTTSLSLVPGAPLPPHKPAETEFAPPRSVHGPLGRWAGPRRSGAASFAVRPGPARLYFDLQRRETPQLIFQI